MAAGSSTSAGSTPARPAGGFGPAGAAAVRDQRPFAAEEPPAGEAAHDARPADVAGRVHTNAGSIIRVLTAAWRSMGRPCSEIPRFIGLSGKEPATAPGRPGNRRRSLEKGVTMTTRPYLVFDGDGELVGSFPDWETAHIWAHRRSVEPRTSRPVQIEDRAGRRTWTVEGGNCRLTVWRRRVEYGYCVEERHPRVVPLRTHAWAS
ncbi:hypothetical protein [Frankia nepalensis]|uniref:hypothetical protein n=1 Tax=Frankia nepalensis TaxID=1836974 RepID=UPI001EE48E01|nr:hypothetical protein [Frankia nepalensis]